MSQRFDDAAERWAIARTLDGQASTYHDLTRLRTHVDTSDCGYVARNIDFGAESEGGCDTCGNYTYAKIDWTFTCQCGYDTAYANYRVEGGIGLATLLEQIMDHDTPLIDELPV
jgi:hypothetical protein